MNPAPRIALIDIETAPILGWTWGMHETDVLSVVKPTTLLSFAYKWLGEKKVHYRGLPNYPGFKYAIRDDKTPTTDLQGLVKKLDDAALTKDMWELFNTADILVGHNAAAFDIKKTNARFLVHGFRPPKSYQTFDTLLAARKHFKMDSSRLDFLAKILGIGAKLPHQGFALWEDCMRRYRAAWAIMEMYNIHDVALLEEVYLKILPWATSHPNITIYTQEVGCHNCGSKDVKREGIFTSIARQYAEYRCNSCGHPFRKATCLKRGEK
jgi:RNase_H superfamily